MDYDILSWAKKNPHQWKLYTIPYNEQNGVKNVAIQEIIEFTAQEFQFVSLRIS